LSIQTGQWFKAKVGLDTNETSRDVAFCSHAIELDDILVINDTFKDVRFADNPLVLDDPKIRFYAGAQLRTNNGLVIGTICAIDRRPRKLETDQIQALRTLAKQVMDKLELRKTLNDLQKYADFLNNQNEEKANLLSLVSHDLRSPFNSILGFSEFLKENSHNLTKDEIQEIGTSIDQTASSTNELLNDLLNWSLSQMNITENNLEYVNLNEIIIQILSVLAGLLSQKNIKVSSNISQSPDICFNKMHIFSALQNIITNSIKFSPINGKIIITTKEIGHNMEIIIEDQGNGMSQKEISLLMKGNNRSSVGTNGEKGVGIGFKIAKDFITLNGGKISIESKINSGTKVIVNVPNNLHFK